MSCYLLTNKKLTGLTTNYKKTKNIKLKRVNKQKIILICRSKVKKIDNKNFEYKRIFAIRNKCKVENNVINERVSTISLQSKKELKANNRNIKKVRQIIVC